MAVIGFKFVRQSTLHLCPTPFRYLRKVPILTYLHLHFSLASSLIPLFISFKAVQKSIVAINTSETSTDENGGGGCGVSIREEGK